MTGRKPIKIHPVFEGPERDVALSYHTTKQLLFGSTDKQVYVRASGDLQFKRPQPTRLKAVGKTCHAASRPAVGCEFFGVDVGEVHDETHGTRQGAHILAHLSGKGIDGSNIARTNHLIHRMCKGG